ncbi:endonuclease/exonuclease/phosphatase family protein [Paenarthrobacter sp. NPDC089989]|uniref:endonuclease/exonuclease/phosphatase family protein n=1 Tax=unclassified Paenarthrobacter TaxID=2634190 RepID=UPI003800C365
MTEPAATLPAVRRRRHTASIAWSVGAVLVALPVASLSLFRAIEGEWPLLVVQALAFMPWLVVPAAVALVLALLGRRRWTVITTAALLAVQLFWLFPLDYGRPVVLKEGTATIPLKVMSLNTEFGEAEAATIVQLVRDHGVQLLALQEFSPALQDRLSAEGLDAVLSNRISTPNDDGSGAAVYSVFPLASEGLLPDTPFRMAATRIVVEGSGAKAALTLTNVHTLPPVDERIGQWRSDLLKVSRQAGSQGNQVLMGDYNATYDHAEFRALLEEGRDGNKLVDVGTATWGRLSPTWPMEGPPLPGVVIDHVVTSPRIGSSAYSVHTVPGTDHAALIAQLSIPAG